MISTNGVKAIFFDLDGTLRYNQPTGHEVFRQGAISLGAPDSEQSRRAALRWSHYYWADSDELLGDLDTHGRDSDDFWYVYAARHLQALGCTSEQARELAPQLHEYMVENYDPDDVISPGVPEMLKALNDAGFTLAVVTNRSESVAEYLDELGLGRFLDFSLAGGEINVWKPDPRIFEAALQRAGARPEQALYVGDSYYADVVGSRSVGIHPVLVDPEGLFPEADCPVIAEASQVQAVLEGELSPENPYPGV